MRVNRRTAAKLLAVAPAVGADAFANQPEPEREWIGPDYWTNPLQDWKLANGRMECRVSGGDRNVFLLAKEVGDRPGDLSMSVKLGRLEGETGPLTEGFAGFRLGMKGRFDDYRDSAIYGTGFNAGIQADGRLFIAGQVSQQAVESFPGPIELRLEVQAETVRLTAGAVNGAPTVSFSGIGPAALQGGVALVCSSGPAGRGFDEPRMNPTMSGFVVPSRTRQGNWRFWFQDWQVAGSKVTEHPDRAFGPILWTMYTLSRGVVKLSAQLAAVGPRTAPVRLQVKRGASWREIAQAPVDPLARNAVFRIPQWDRTRDTAFRVVYRMDRDHTWEGTIRKDPTDKPKIVLAALSCLNDFGFPHRDLLESIGHFNPDLLAFQGDQIYERCASYEIQRSPVEPAVLDFMRKWYLFGWSFRDLMRHTPTVCQTDDHDMYHGNIWGAGGRHAEGSGQDGQDSGGYLEPAIWVNTVQRAQTSHLPDPVDPAPVDQNIGVYFTHLCIGGVSFAIMEDRKWKSAPKVLLPAARIRNGWAQNPQYNAARDGNVAGAQLLGDRQLKFLEAWARDWRQGVWMKVVLSQTLFVNLATLPPPANTDAVVPGLPILQPDGYAEGDIVVADHDSNAWPQAGRDAALRIWRKCAALHVCGDQHLGSTSQYGVEEWRDASFAFCSPALSNLFPRRWYPSQPGGNSLPRWPRNTGDFTDGFGNKMTVHAVYNPQQSDAQPNALMDRSPGFGILEFDRATREIAISPWPRRIDPRAPGAHPADGWPVRIAQLDNGWSSCAWRLPPVEAGGLRNFCVEVRDGADTIYTLRIQGDSFAPPVRHEGTYSVRVFDPDGSYQRLHAGLEAVKAAS